jgi:hypothetical protein
MENRSLGLGAPDGDPDPGSAERLGDASEPVDDARLPGALVLRMVALSVVRRICLADAP